MLQGCRSPGTAGHVADDDLLVDVNPRTYHPRGRTFRYHSNSVCCPTCTSTHQSPKPAVVVLACPGRATRAAWPRLRWRPRRRRGGRTRCGFRRSTCRLPRPGRCNTCHTVVRPTLTWNIGPINGQTRASVHRWSSTQPAFLQHRLQHRRQPLHLGIGRSAIRTRCAVGHQCLLTAGNPGPPPRVRRLRRDLPHGSDLHRAHPIGEHPRRLPADLLPTVSTLRATRGQ